MQQFVLENYITEEEKILSLKPNSEKYVLTFESILQFKIPCSGVAGTVQQTPSLFIQLLIPLLPNVQNTVFPKPEELGS